ncbi:hypothetical protein OFR34_14520 [Brachyspira hyodysenteriae]|nr:hypothetical protein [Brachyspira hyodysenteriae]MDA0002137.1 hypothetical protein [Brachyspira hyodysenteriae]
MQYIIKLMILEDYYQGPIECGPSMGDRPNLCYEYKGYRNRCSSGEE